MLPFQDAAPTPASDWRHIVRFGRNVASYKFALGRALLDLAVQQQTFVPLPDLALPYAAGICKHLQVEDRQSTSARSQFLDACRSRNRGELAAAQLAEATVWLGFTNVIDAFHISRGGQPTQTRFFTDERASRQGITLTDHLLELANGLQASRRLLRRCTPQQLISAQVAAVGRITGPEPDPRAQPANWQQRVSLLQVSNTRPGSTAPTRDQLIPAAIYPDAIALATSQLAGIQH